MQRPVEDQPRHLTQVRLPRPGLAERLLGEGTAGGALQWGDRHCLLGGQEGQGFLPNQQLQPHAVLQRRARLRASVGSHRHLRPHEGGPAARWVIQRNFLFYEMMFSGNGHWPLSPFRVIRKVCHALGAPQRLFVLNAKNASALKYLPARSVILLALISFSHPPLKMGVLFYATGNHSTSGAFPVWVVIKGTLQTAAQLVSWLPNNFMEKDPGDFQACAIVSCRGCGFKL